MRKNVIAAIAGAMVLCLAAAGCAGTQTSTTSTADTANTVAAATTAAAAEAATEATAAEAVPDWRDQDDSYLSGIKAEEIVDLPEKYDHLEVEAQKPVEVTDEEVEESIQTTLRTNAPLEEVDRKVEEGDTVNIDFVGKLDGEEFEGGSGTYDLVIGSHSFIDGFEDGLIGAKKGETRDLELTFPEDYGAAELAGKEVVFTVTVNTISEYDIPDLDDDYVRSLNLTDSFGNAVTSVEAYKEYERSNLTEQRESAYRETVLAACMNKLLAESSFKGEAPANMKDQYNDSMTRMFEYMALRNYMELKDLMINYYQATEDNYLEMIGDLATTQMNRDIILQAIADKEDLNPDEDEVEEAIAKYVESEDTIESADDIGRYAKEFLRDELMRDNVYNWLVDHCKVEEPSEEEADEAQTGETSAAAATEETAAADTGETAAAAEEADAADTGETAAAAEEENDGEKSDEENSDEENSDEENSDEENSDDKN